MKFLVLNTDYPEFLNWLYNKRSGLENQSYEEQMRMRNESLFGVADFYSSNLHKWGHEAWDIHANNEFIQKAWAKEYGINIKSLSSFNNFLQTVFPPVADITARIPSKRFKYFIWPFLRSLDSWFYKILEAQIKYYKPDILLNHAMIEINNQFLKEIKPHVRMMVGQIASPLPKDSDFSCYDLVISSLPNFVEYFRRKGVKSELHRLAFEPQISDMLDNKKREIPVSFVGSLSKNHKNRISLLEYLCSCFEIAIWGVGVDHLPKDSIIRQYYKGNVWGVEMYKILNNSKITLNHHIDIAGSYANNMRLFEATGVGALLITDWKVNLHEMFEVGKEVIAYRTADECAEVVKYYLEHDKERETIAKAGQERTRLEHTYYKRMKEFVDIVQKYL